MSHLAPIVVSAVGIVVIVLAAVLGFVVLPNIVDNTIEKELQLVRGSDTWNKWVEISSPIYLKFYVYNVTNPNATESGQDPILEERGPYYYRQRRQKIDPWSNTCKETVLYEQKITYTFDAEKSWPNTEDDRINIINAPLVSVVGSFLNRGFTESAASFARLLGSRGETLIRRNVTVGELTFKGFPIPAYSILPPDLLPPEFSGGTFGLYKIRNGTTDGLYEVNTGALGSEKFGVIKQWEGSNNLTFWKNDSCNLVRGSDGSIFPPFFEKDGSIEIFNTELCRILKLDYQKEVEVNGIKAFRFSPTAAELRGPVNNPENSCYCPREDPAECKDGTIFLSPCKNGAPIVLSTPHFLDGDSSLSADMGLTPNRELHETTIDIEPRTGLLLEAHKRIQINFDVRILVNNTQFAHLPKNWTFPAVWVDEEASMCPVDVDDFKSRIEKPIKTINITRWVFIGVGVALVVIAAGLVFFSSRRSNSTKTV